MFIDEINEIFNNHTMELPNLMAFIDIAWILLVFFILMSNNISKQVPISSVQSSGGITTQGKPMSIFLDEAGNYYSLSKLISKEDLKVLVKNYSLNSSKSIIIINPDKKVTAQILMDTINVCKVAGAENISIGAETK